MTEPRQPWVKPPHVPEAPDTANLQRLFNQLEERANAREQRMKLFLALLPLIWGGISFILWFAYFYFVVRRD